jgi:hypothetical protein
MENVQEQQWLRLLMDLLREGLIDEKTALERCEPNKLDELLHPVFDKEALKIARYLHVVLPASPGAACGQIVFFADDASQWHKMVIRLLWYVLRLSLKTLQECLQLKVFLLPVAV